jgi:CBS domain-containing protein
MMQRRVASVHPTEGLDRAARLMREHRCGSVVVIDTQERPVAMLTDRDICMAVLQNGRTLADTQVADAMSARVVTCAVDDSVLAAEDRMALNHVRRLPVVDPSGRLRGVLALDDLAREACEEEDLLLPPVSCEAVGRTLGRVARPRVQGVGEEEAWR